MVQSEIFVYFILFFLIKIKLTYEKILKTKKRCTSICEDHLVKVPPSHLKYFHRNHIYSKKVIFLISFVYKLYKLNDYVKKSPINLK